MTNAALRRLRVLSIAIVGLAAATSVAAAQKKYDAGASDTEIRIGNTMPYSGPASSYSVIGKAEEAYFRKVNDEGGINGRKIKFISYDDGYSPPKTVEQTRKLVEGDEVLLTFSSIGTPTNLAVRKYLNQKQVPQLFIASGGAAWNNPKEYPWTMGWQPNYQSEGRIYAKYLLKEKPEARIAVLYQNDDSGKDYLKGFKEGLGSRAATMIVAEESYEVSEPTIDTHIVKLKSTSADVFFDASSSKFSAQAIRKMAEIGWKPFHILNGISVSIGGTIKPAGFENAQGIVSTAFIKDPNDPQWTNDPAMKEWSAFLDKYYPDANRRDIFVVYGYSLAQTLVQVLKQCGDDLTRANVMKQAAGLRDFELSLLLPGVKVTTGPNDFAPIEQMQLMTFKGESWELFGEVISGEVGE